jgi:Flp pilus assembly protein CpaB
VNPQIEAALRAFLPAAPTQRRVRTMVGARRRLIAAALAALAVALLARGVRSERGGGVPVLAAARDLAGGVPLTTRDLRTLVLPSDAVPAGSLRPGAAVAGRVLAAPVRRGEPLTDVRLVGPGLLAGPDRGLVAAPVRIADPGAARLLRPGDRIDLLAAGGTGVPPAAASPGPASPDASAGLGTGDPARSGSGGDTSDSSTGTGTGSGTVVAENVRVLAVPRSDDAAGPLGGGDGALVVLEVPRPLAGALARAAAGSNLSVALRPAS